MVLRLVYVEHVSGVLVRSGCQAPCFGIELASSVPFHRGQDSVMLLWRNAVPVLDTSEWKALPKMTLSSLRPSKLQGDLESFSRVSPLVISLGCCGPRVIGLFSRMRKIM